MHVRIISMKERIWVTNIEVWRNSPCWKIYSCFKLYQLAWGCEFASTNGFVHFKSRQCYVFIQIRWLRNIVKYYHATATYCLHYSNRKRILTLVHTFEIFMILFRASRSRCYDKLSSLLFYFLFIDCRHFFFHNPTKRGRKNATSHNLNNCFKAFRFPWIRTKKKENVTRVAYEIQKFKNS